MAVTVDLSAKALLTEAEATAYLQGDEATELSDTQKDNIRRLINGVSSTFERMIDLPLIKQDYTEIINAKGKLIIWLKNYPIDTDESGDPEIAVYTRSAHDEDWTEEDTDDYYVDTDTGRLEITGFGTYTGVATTKIEYTAGIGEQTRNEETGELESVDIDDDWRSMALQAVHYLHQKDLASFSRVQEGVAIPASALPPLVREFLRLNKKAMI